LHLGGDPDHLPATQRALALHAQGQVGVEVQQRVAVAGHQAFGQRVGKGGDFGVGGTAAMAAQHQARGVVAVEHLLELRADEGAKLAAVGGELGPALLQGRQDAAEVVLHQLARAAGLCGGGLRGRSGQHGGGRGNQQGGGDRGHQQGADGNGIHGVTPWGAGGGGGGYTQDGDGTGGGGVSDSLPTACSTHVST